MTQRCALRTAHGGEHLFVQTRATTRLLGECPAIPSHSPATRESKVSVAGMCLWRVPCQCGWRGCWFSTEGHAEVSIQRHLLTTKLPIPTHHEEAR